MAALGDLLRDLGCFDPPPAPVTPSPTETSEYSTTGPLALDVVVIKEEAGMSAQMCGEEKHRAGWSVADGAQPKEKGSNSVGLAPQHATSSPAGLSADDSKDMTITNGDGERAGTMSVASYSYRAAESQAQEAVEGLRFHLSALYRAVDLANSNMREARQEFGLLLQKVQDGICAPFVQNIETEDRGNFVKNAPSRLKNGMSAMLPADNEIATIN